MTLNEFKTNFGRSEDRPFQKVVLRYNLSELERVDLVERVGGLYKKEIPRRPISQTNKLAREIIKKRDEQ